MFLCFFLFCFTFLANIFAEKPYCECGSPVGSFPFNFSCIHECYLSNSSSKTCSFPSLAYTNCDLFLKNYLKTRNSDPLIGPKRVVDVFKPLQGQNPTTVIALKSEIDMRFSFDGLSSYQCNLTLAELRKAKSKVQKCFHYSKNCFDEVIASQECNICKRYKYLKQDLVTLENYKSCIFNSYLLTNMGNFSGQHPRLYANLNSPTAIKTSCQVLKAAKTFQTIEFPLELKGSTSLATHGQAAAARGIRHAASTKNKQYPSNDIELRMHITRVSRNLHSVQLSWTCPSEWNGFPDIYKVVCTRILHSRYNHQCDECWEVADNFDDANATHLSACKGCWDDIAGFLDKPNRSGKLETEPYHISNLHNHYLGFPVNWRLHNTTFLIRNCGTACFTDLPNSKHAAKRQAAAAASAGGRARQGTEAGAATKGAGLYSSLYPKTTDSGLNVWWNANSEAMGLICAIKAKNTKERKKANQPVFGTISQHLAVGKLQKLQPEKYIQLHYWKKPGELCPAGILWLQSWDNDLVQYIHTKRRFGGQSSLTQRIAISLPIANGLHAFPKSIQQQRSEIRNESACYDWLSQRWYFVVKSRENRTIPYVEEHKIKETDFAIIHAHEKPKQVGCIPSKSMILWTENRDAEPLLLNAARISLQTDGQLNAQLFLYKNISELISCHNCSAIGYLASQAFDIDSTYGDASIAIVSTTGLWKLSLERCTCQKLASWQDISSGPFNGVSDIKSFSLFSQDTIYFSTKSRTLLKLRLPNTWTNIEHYFQFSVKVPNEMLEDLPGFPSHLMEPVKINDTKTYVCNQFFIYKVQSTAFGNVQAGVVPDDCLFPNMRQGSGGKVEFQMVSETVANITIYPSFSTKSCTGSNKPPVIYKLRYGIISDEDQSSLVLSCENASCPCDLEDIGPCRVETSAPSRFQPVSMTVAHLIPDQNYIVEVLAFPNPLTSSFFPEFSREVLDQNVDTTKHRAFVSKYRAHYEPKTKNVVPVAVGTAIPLLIILTILVGWLVYVYKKRWYMYRNLSRIAPSDIKRKKKLGEGHFGEVWEAELLSRNKTIPIAIKLLNEAAGEKEKRQFLEEAIILSKLSHPNIVSSVGICMSSKPVILALEFLNGGSLQSFLRQVDVRQQLHLDDLLHIALEVCKGCGYLEKRGYIHRDISAKNCLLSLHHESVKPKQVKLADFGLAKDTAQEDVYSAGLDAIIPIPYTSPEGLLHGDFSSKADVWSFGVLMWEIFSFGATPFGKCFECHSDVPCPLKQYSLIEVEFMVAIDKKSLSDLQDPCFAIFNESIKNLMDQCWKFKSKDRPTFSQLEKYIHTLQKVKSSPASQFHVTHAVQKKQSSLSLKSPAPENVSTGTAEAEQKLSVVSAKPAYMAGTSLVPVYQETSQETSLSDPLLSSLEPAYSATEKVMVTFDPETD